MLNVEDCVGRPALSQYGGEYQESERVTPPTVSTKSARSNPIAPGDGTATLVEKRAIEANRRAWDCDDWRDDGMAGDGG